MTTESHAESKPAQAPGPFFAVGPLDVFREPFPEKDEREPVFMFGMRDHGPADRDELVELLNKGTHFDSLLASVKELVPHLLDSIPLTKEDQEAHNGRVIRANAAIAAAEPLA